MKLRLLFMLLFVLGPAAADTVHVAVASNFTVPLRLLAASFEEQSGHQIKISAASTGKLYAQIKHGAPYHLFLAADQARPERLVQDGLAIADSRFTYALGRLVLWAPGERFDGSADELMAKVDVRRFAIANPKTAPYGVAAQQTLEEIGQLTKLRGRLVRGENIAQTFQFVASGAAEMGLVALAQLSGENALTGYHWVVPQEMYEPIRQEAVLLKRGEDNLAAKAFLHHLRSTEARALIVEQGYGLE
ncbi:Molybdenum ABC transporter, substrate-binding protein ModA [hydrothermal vent metagenome]|uniref:Molybdenum ABC transporter, substrate-binding protein ModA n=1 Tax=hydrothermal vent metagenome TaxID=652676 RepID=A0A3B1BT47_9ZZZZ